MDIDEKFKELIFFLEESVRIKIFLIGLFQFILNIYGNFKELEVFDENAFCNYLKEIIRSILTQIDDLKIFEENFYFFLSHNPNIIEFLQKTKLDPSIVKTQLNFQYEFLDELRSQDRSSLDKITDIEEDIEDLKSERDFIARIIYNVKNELETYEKCFICTKKGNERFGTHKCERCRRSICSKHLFTSKLCKICVKRYHEDKES